MIIGSLFSGIGGLELGLEWSGLGPVAWQVEKDPYCRSVLQRHWPNTPLHEDVRNVGSHNLPPVDLICGGFPCQDVSSAGPRTGLAGERSGLWREFARVVSELRPRWVVVENVTSGASLWVDAVVNDLEQLGYETLPIPLRADALGAPYPRARLFVVGRLANAHRKGEHPVPVHAEVAGPRSPQGVARGAREAPDPHGVSVRLKPRWRDRQGGQSQEVNPEYRWSQPMPCVAGVVPRLPRGLAGAAARAAGNCAVPAQAEVVGWMIQELDAPPVQEQSDE